MYGVFCVSADDGSRLWLRQEAGADADISVPRHTPVLDIAAAELRQAWHGVPVRLELRPDKRLTPEGFRIVPGEEKITIASPGETGLLYGAYYLLRRQAVAEQQGKEVEIRATTENPAYARRILNHWDNLDGTVERGYAGRSLWCWDELPDTLSPRYEAYARANASVGINGTVLNNVNASPQILTARYLQKVKALADVFRPYGIRVYLSVNFASPMLLGGLPTADPVNREVVRWWQAKVREIYTLIPDFGGFLVKANSEGQPGPCDYGRTHAEGANMLADALEPYGGIVMWRAFVYSPSDADRAKQAYAEFMPLDGRFRPNVVVQIKNGPVDFQPREPYSPLFTAMRKTPVMAEFQITQEYLGQANHLVYLAPMWREFFDLVRPASLSAVAGVANIGDTADWCGHPFAPANWYAFGRMAWDPTLSPGQIADEWLWQSLYADAEMSAEKRALHTALVQLMTGSREAAVDYMMPLGLHHLFAWGHHYGPEPWCDVSGARADWLPRYYHRVDSAGLGFDRSATGSCAAAQYPRRQARRYGHIGSCPEAFLLWFHHVPWTHRMACGATLWQSLCRHYDRGVRRVREFRGIWEDAAAFVDDERFRRVQRLLQVQERDAVWWKDACLLYFQTFSGMPFPDDVEPPVHRLEELMRVKLPVSNYECPSPDLLNLYR